MPPSWRFDLRIEEDLIEEVIRVLGFGKLPDTPPIAPVTARVRPESSRSTHAVRRAVAALDYQETINFSFVEARWEHELAGNADPIQVLKPRPSRPHGWNHRRVLWLPCANRRSLAQIMNQRSRRGRCLRMLAQPKALKPRHSKMIFEESRRMIRLEQPIIEPCFNGPEAIQLARSRHR